jgi:pimeloyl-ACP methyl ester carboxylesterase
MPVRAWGGERFMGDISSLWKTVADNVQGGAIERCGHFVAEERPDFVLRQIEEIWGPLG